MDRNHSRDHKTVNGVTTKYWWDGDRIVYQTDGTTYIRFYYDTNGTAIGFNSNIGTLYYVRNAQGDVTDLLGQWANVIAHYTYDTWGNVVKVTDANGADITGDMTHIGNIQPLRYQGYYYDNETGYYYLQSRYLLYFLPIVAEIMWTTFLVKQHATYMQWRGHPFACY